MVVLIVFAALAFPIMRWRARRIESSGADSTDALHRLQVGNLVFLGVFMLVVVLGFAELEIESGNFDGPAKAIGVVVLLVLSGVALALSTLASRPTYLRLRGLDPSELKKARPARRGARMLLILLLPQALWFGALVVLHRTQANGFVQLGAVVGFVLLVAVCTPILLRAARASEEPDERVRAIVDEVCQKADVRVGGVRILDTRHNPVANAAFAGFGPGPKYVFLTDTLVEELSDEELEAVLAHEIGHRKHHHIAWKLGVQLVTLLVGAFALAGLAVAAHHLLPSAATIVVAFLLPLLLLVSLFVTQGLLGLRLENQADDFAVAMFGAAPLRQALDKLASLNMTKRRTGRAWNLLTRHPGVAQRLERLEKLEETAASEHAAAS